MSTAINNLARNIRYLNLDQQVELLVVDWGSHSPLYLDLTLSEEARKLCCFILVPRMNIQTLTGSDCYNRTIAKNVAGVRASGRYLLFLDADLILPLESWIKLFWAVREGQLHDYKLDETFFWTACREVQTYFCQVNPHIHRVDEEIEKNFLTFDKTSTPDPLLPADTKALLLSRNCWLEACGWDETIPAATAADKDLHSRLSTRYACGNLDQHNIRMFHLGHCRATETSESEKRNFIQREASHLPGLSGQSLRCVDGQGREVSLSHRPDLVRSKSKSSELQNISSLLEENLMHRRLRSATAYQGDCGYFNSGLLDILVTRQNPRVVAEIGSGLGASSKKIASFPSVETLYCIDTWDPTTWYPDASQGESECADLFAYFLSTCSHDSIAHKIFPIRTKLDRATEIFYERNIRLDLIYIKQPINTAEVISQIGLASRVGAPDCLICLEISDPKRFHSTTISAIERLIAQRGWKSAICDDYIVIYPRPASGLTIEVIHCHKQENFAAQNAAHQFSLPPFEREAQEPKGEDLN